MRLLKRLCVDWLQRVLFWVQLLWLLGLEDTHPWRTVGTNLDSWQWEQVCWPCLKWEVYLRPLCVLWRKQGSVSISFVVSLGSVPGPLFPALWEHIALIICGCELHHWFGHTVICGMLPSLEKPQPLWGSKTFVLPFDAVYCLVEIRFPVFASFQVNGIDVFAELHGVEILRGILNSKKMRIWKLYNGVEIMVLYNLSLRCAKLE